jgi:hypothetical protein
MDEKKAFAAEVREHAGFAGEIGKFKTGKDRSGRQPFEMSVFTQSSGALIRCRRATLQGVQTQEDASLLLHQLVEAHPDAEQDQQEEKCDHNLVTPGDSGSTCYEFTKESLLEIVDSESS